MHAFPETPPLAEADPLTGHLWIQERPTGGRLRFRIADSGRIVLGTDRPGDAGADLPPPYRPGARTVRERVDRDAFLSVADDPDAVTFFGVATWNEGIDYDWSALPAFVGTDVRAGSNGACLSPDAATAAFERLDLPALPAVETELPRSRADLDRYEGADRFPESAYRDGPAAGLLVRDKTGGRARIDHPDHPGRAPGDVSNASETTATAETLAAECATPAAIDRTVERLRDEGQAPTVGAVRDRLVADLARERYASLFPGGEPVVPVAAFESAVAERVQRRLYRST
ncbi:MAG: hypothetical protein ABEH56_05410 [Salinirussus sp.]